MSGVIFSSPFPEPCAWIRGTGPEGEVREGFPFGSAAVPDHRVCRYEMRGMPRGYPFRVGLQNGSTCLWYSCRPDPWVGQGWL